MDGLEYERRAWDELQAAKLARATKVARTVLPETVRKRALQVQQRTLDFLASVPGAALLQDAVTKSLDGVNRLLGSFGTSTVWRARILRAYRKRGHVVPDLTAIRALPLREVDAVKPGSLDLAYGLVSGVAGAVSGAAITGGQVVAAGGSLVTGGAAAAPGAGLIASAMAGDAAVTLTAMQRGLAHAASYYGYDVRRPEERLFALSVLSAGVAQGSAKGVAYAQLSRLTQDLARRATWRQLNEHALTKITQAVYQRLGLTLTQKKLGQVVPAVGVLIGAGLNAAMLHSALEDFDLLYRERFLTDRYGPTGPVGSAPVPDFAPVIDGEVIDAELVDVEALVDAELEQAPAEPDRAR